MNYIHVSIKGLIYYAKTYFFLPANLAIKTHKTSIILQCLPKRSLKITVEILLQFKAIELHSFIIDLTYL